MHLSGTSGTDFMGKQDGEISKSGTRVLFDKHACYMVDEALYRDILLAMAARSQNEQLLAAASERFEQYIEQIVDSNERIIQREKNAMEQLLVLAWCALSSNMCSVLAPLMWVNRSL